MCDGLMFASTWAATGEQVPREGGTARINRRLLAKEDSSGESVFSNPSANVRSPRSPVSDYSDAQSSRNEYVRLPAEFDSKETLSFLGFCDDQAELVWARWVGFSQEDREVSPGLAHFSLVCARTHNHMECCGPESDWNAALDDMGVSSSMKQAIMTPMFDSIRLTDSAGFWVEQSVMDRAMYLEGRMKESHNGSKFFNSVDGAGTIPPSGGSRFQVASSSAAQLTGPPGTTVLWRGTTCDRAVRIWRSGHVGQGDINLFETAMNPPGDFDARQLLGYFTTQIETAQKYATYAAQRAENRLCDTPCLLRLEVPNSVIEAITPTCRLEYPSTDWKRTVFYCRRREDFPRDLSWVKRSKIRYGHTATSLHGTFGRIGSAEEVGDRHLLKVDINGVPTIAEQVAIAWYDTDVTDSFNEACRSSIGLRNCHFPSEVVSHFVPSSA